MSRFTGQDLTCIRGERVVFTGLDFEVAAGEALLLLGSNGSGKSSLLRLMAGLGRPAAGTLSWDGTPVSADPETHGGRLHYVGHLDALKPALTVAENLTVWARLKGGGGGSIEGALARFGLERLAALPARLLSAGQRRRLALARIAATAVPLWLLDEPTVALDRQSVAALEAAIVEHCTGGGLAVVSSNVDFKLPAPKILKLGDYAADSADIWELDG